MNQSINNLITEYKTVHADKTWGISGNLFCSPIQVILSELQPKSILNYGCGQTGLQNRLDLGDAIYYRYDPAIPEFSELPVQKADFLINTDVLEHIPKTHLPEVLAEMASISQYALINIAIRPAKEILPNGQNAHCTIKTASEWNALLLPYFPQTELILEQPNYSVLFLTWNSPLKDAIAGLAELPELKKKLKKARKTRLQRIGNELGRLKQRLKK